MPVPRASDVFDDVEAADRQVVDFHFFEHGFADGETSHGERADCQGAHGECADGERAQQIGRDGGASDAEFPELS